MYKRQNQRKATSDWMELEKQRGISITSTVLQFEYEKSALELKKKCGEINNEILTNDYYASLKASYTLKELKNFIYKKKLSSLEVFEEGDEYLVIYGKV